MTHTSSSSCVLSQTRLNLESGYQLALHHLHGVLAEHLLPLCRDGLVEAFLVQRGHELSELLCQKRRRLRRCGVQTTDRRWRMASTAPQWHRRLTHRSRALGRRPRCARACGERQTPGRPHLLSLRAGQAALGGAAMSVTRLTRGHADPPAVRRGAARAQRFPSPADLGSSTVPIISRR
jgi:hypothetical protein